MTRSRILAVAPILPIFVLALQYWGIQRSPDLPDVWSFWMLLATLVAAVVFFGSLPSRWWAVAGIGAAAAMAGFNVIAIKLNIAWRVSGGVPENWLLELSAIVFVLLIPAALLAGTIACIACARRWFVGE
ncbi:MULTISPECIES: hypothetical protein [unclassified Brevundimonas]|uniref:hypothetical protein n=1 Tax=unclassified Brevundimonas TaxID=2622653 RepID=UPI000CFD1BCD|nr:MULTISPECIES: hypothetical protein [unclassified Brevundimonas]PRA26159.1 hypothetical protein CQ024_13545 [Brevundimonas sp. MYb27]PQZ81717.1 hypothetical protein CQ026_09490 [Brevundimonas sp. MYb31]PRB17512.1 hypothetical protein CQ039_00210 [Brevundimonas sp. MYb52]PRB37885.1 hypothetical protein CQ035_00210 [Brevundimonas sp. MYb46]PRB45771.1 hypothetical protein CQ028_12520 [Brevundimonas sp. MYb33]